MPAPRPGQSLWWQLVTIVVPLLIIVGAQAAALWTLAGQSQPTTAMLRGEIVLSLVMAAVIGVGCAVTIRGQRRSAKLARVTNEFVSNVSHDLRTPLCSIALTAELLRRHGATSPAKVREYAGRIEAQTARLLRSVTNILEVTRIESHRRSYSMADVDIGVVAGDAVRTIGVWAAQKGFTLNYTPPPAGVAAVAVADATAIADAVVNLVDNAMKYSGDSREVDIWTDRTADAVTIHVRDHGIGIPARERSRIFDKFYRAPASSSAATGAGLGLAIVKHAAEAHGGRVIVHSRPGQGSTFSIVLPAAPTPIRARARSTAPVRARRADALSEHVTSGVR